MLRKLYKDWTLNTNERQKLQTVFATVTFASLLVAGMIALVDRELGLRILNVAYVAAFVWVINFVTWAIYLALTTQTPEQPVQKSTSSRRNK